MFFVEIPIDLVWITDLLELFEFVRLWVIFDGRLIVKEGRKISGIF